MTTDNTRHADIRAGDVIYVRAAPGLTDGRRGRAGLVFTDTEVTNVTVVDGSRVLVGNEVHVPGARLIMQDESLIILTEVQWLAAENARLVLELETKSRAADKQIADLRNTVDEFQAQLDKAGK